MSADVESAAAQIADLFRVEGNYGDPYVEYDGIELRRIVASVEARAAEQARAEALREAATELRERAHGYNVSREAWRQSGDSAGAMRSEWAENALISAALAVEETLQLTERTRPDDDE